MLRTPLILSVIFHLAVLLGSHVADMSRLPEFAPKRQSSAVLAHIAVSGQQVGKASPTLTEKRVKATASSVIATAAPIPKTNFVASAAVLAKTGEISPSVKAATMPAENRAERGELPAPERDEVSFEGVRQYRLAIAREARRYKNYPAIARERSWAGLVLIRVNFAGIAAVPGITLIQSSGFDVLDAQAVEMTTKAVRSAPLPDSLKGRSFALELPVRYVVDD